MRKHIVMTSFGSYGDINPYLGLALGLRQRGYEMVIATSEYYRNTIEAQGIGFHPVRPTIEPSNDLLRRVMDADKGTEVILKELLFPFLRDTYEDLMDATKQADLLVTHPITFAGPIVAEKRKMRWVSTVLSPISFFSAYDLPVFPRLPQLVKMRRFGHRVSALLISYAKFVTRTWSEPVRKLRKEVGLPAGKDPIFEGQFSPELVLALFSRVLAEPQPDWPPHTRITGQVFYDGPQGEQGLLPELCEFLESGSPPVVFTLGSSAVGAAGNFYQESLEAVKQLRLRAVLLVGTSPDNRPRGTVPSNVGIFEYAPFSHLFPHAAAIVHQGGIGTTGQALRAGRPMLVVPFAHDQPDNAFRAQNLGVARTLYRQHYSASRVAEALRILLSDPSYSQRACQVGDQVRSEEGIRAACDAIEELLAQP
jgi:rhamnosyltransferase subunit B